MLPSALPGSDRALPGAARQALQHGPWSQPDTANAGEELLFELFAVPFDRGRLPAAPVAYLGARGEDPATWCMMADPVHLHARRHELIMVRAPDLTIAVDEAAELAALLEREYADLGWRLSVMEPDSWVLFPGAVPDLLTSPPARIGAHNVDPYLPDGPDALEWRRRLNEIQMLFHDASVNNRRESAARLPINSVWFWGGGTLPAPVARTWDQVYAADDLTRGLAALTGTPISRRPPADTEIRDLLQTGDRKVLISLPDDADSGWMQVLLSLLEDGGGRVRLIRPDGAAMVPQAPRRRWWQALMRGRGPQQ